MLVGLAYWFKLNHERVEKGRKGHLQSETTISRIYETNHGNNTNIKRDNLRIHQTLASNITNIATKFKHTVNLKEIMGKILQTCVTRPSIKLNQD